MGYSTVKFDYDEIAPNYDHTFKKYDYIAPRETFNAVAGTIDIQAPSLRVLDIGIGTGLLSFFFRQANDNAYIAGVDISPGMLAECRGKNIADELVCTDFDTARSLIRYGDQTFDVAVSSGVFELLSKPREVIAEMARVLKPNGIIAFTCPSRLTERPWTIREYIPNACRVLNWIDRGTAHSRRKLIGAMNDSGIEHISEKDFIGYRKYGSGAPYKLYVGCKLS